MGVSFAGSRSLDARRRRRLATDQLAQEQKPRSRAKAKKLYINPIEELQKRTKPRAETPIHSLIPSRPGRFLLMNLALVAVWLFLLTLSATTSLWAPHVAPKLSSFVEAGTGAAWPLTTGLTFLFTAQMSWIVYWYRRHSRRDFNGHYRIWLWTSLDWTMMGLGALTGVHQLIAQTLVSWFHLPRDPYENLLWMAPLAGILINLGHGLDREMASSKVGWRMLCLALTSSLLVGFMLIGWEPFPNAWANSFFVTAASTFVPLALLIATLNQLYFVLYVTSESVQKQGSLLSSTGKRVSASTSRFFMGSLLTTGWLFSQLGRFYKYAMSMLFSLLLWKKIEVDTSKKSKKTKAKPKAKTPAKAVATTTKGRGKKVVEEEPAEAEEELEEEVAEEEPYEEEAYEEESEEYEQEEEASEEEYDEEAEETAEEEAAEEPQEEEWNQEAWEAEMRAYEESQNSTSPKSKSKNSQQSTSSKQQSHQRTHQAHSTPAPKQEERWEQEEPASNASSRATQSYDEEEQWQDDEGGGEDYSDGMDPNDLRGMSKKERRRLRKQHRDQQRGRG